MYKHIIKLRVRYSETDKMGVVYYGNYPQYFEVGRVEYMRDMGVVYAELEKQGILMPVVNLEISYRAPGLYDEELTIETWIEKLPTSKIVFKNKVLGEDGRLICEGKETLVFVNDKFKPTQPPVIVVEALKSKGLS